MSCCSGHDRRPEKSEREVIAELRASQPYGAITAGAKLIRSGEGVLDLPGTLEEIEEWRQRVLRRIGRQFAAPRPSDG